MTRVAAGLIFAAMELILAAVCDAARGEEGEKLDLFGVFNELNAPGFPAVQESMTVVLVLEWDEEDAGRQEIRADLVDDDGKAVLTIQGQSDIEWRGDGRAAPQTRLKLQVQDVVFPHAGRYVFEVRAGGIVRRGCPIFVGHQPSATQH